MERLVCSEALLDCVKRGVSPLLRSAVLLGWLEASVGQRASSEVLIGECGAWCRPASVECGVAQLLHW